jgi:SAM-dependent methyltransferase
VDSYGDYILSTGKTTEAWEALFNRYFFESRFAKYERIVDLGPGRCAFSRQAPEKIVAVDNAPAIVERYRREGVDIRLGSAYELPFADVSVDAVYSCWLFEHLEDPAAAMVEIARVLRPGGYVCLIVPSEKSLRRGFYNDYTHVRPFTATSMRQLADVARFSRNRTDYLFWTRGLRRLIPVLGEDRMIKILRLSEAALWRLHIANRLSLVFEGWK